jgi:DNA-binding transcriptional regulator YbjK
MVTPNRPSQERSRVRRDALLQAAVALLAEGGARAITHRAVASRAGVPLAATTYYFASIQQLTEEALRRHVHARIAELRDLASAAAQSSTTVEQIAAKLVDALVGRDPSATIAQFEVYLEAARNPALRAPVAEALDAFEDLALSLLTSLGARRPEQAAAGFVALINGFALSQLGRPTPGDAANLLEMMRALFIVQVMPEAELATWRRRLATPIVDVRTDLDR